MMYTLTLNSLSLYHFDTCNIQLLAIFFVIVSFESNVNVNSFFVVQNQWIKIIYRVVYEIFWKIWIWSSKMPSKLRQNFTLITVLSIDWYELCSKCSEMIHITDQNILRSEGNIFRLRLSHNWVQVDQKWTKMGQMVHTNNKNCKMYKLKTLYLLDLAFAHFWT